MIVSEILVTGGTGYIGSHTVVELLAAGRDVFIVDSLENSKPAVLARIEAIAGRRPGFLQLDVRNAAALARLFADRDIEAVVHFAGLKAVGESVEQPLRYYDTNVHGSLALLKAMAARGVRKFVFSSSATVYGEPERVPIREDSPLSPASPYGRSKRMVEEMLRDLTASDSAWRIAILRYFNPVGAHPSGLIGEDPHGIPNNLMPFIAQVAVGRRKELAVFGDDYPTPDGTGLRDYIHVVDLARGHLAALSHLEREAGLLAVNLGTGQGCSVLDMVRAFAAASGRAVPFRVAPRRAGDIAAYWADPALAGERLGWRAERGIREMCEDAWRWQARNPDGYPG